MGDMRALPPKLLALLVSCTAIFGCGPSKPSAKVEDSRQNLQRIGSAYFQATTALQHPPNNIEELLPYLKSSNPTIEPQAILRSANDGEEYVIIWGVDFAKLAEAQIDPAVVYAYEKKGGNGKRLVLKGPVYVAELTDAEFRQAKFPPGSQPPT